MLKQIFALVFVCLLYMNAFACDACSCISMNSLDGQLLPSNKSLFGFSSNYVHQLNANEQKIHNMSYSLFGAYSFAKRWQVLVNLPLQQNLIVNNQEANTSQVGLGDASILLSYMPFTTKDENKKSKSTFILRGGIKLPTGYYDADNLATSNLGTKSVDFLFSTQYIFERNNQGLNVALNTRWNTQNKFDYKYGNRYDISAFYFVKRDVKKSAYMPFAGLSGEYIKTDQSNGFERTLSGGQALYGIGGFLWKWDNKLALFIRGELPIIQNFKSPDGNVFTNVRGQIQLSYFLKDKQKVSKKLKL